jgi:hypothetical protein
MPTSLELTPVRCSLNVDLARAHSRSVVIGERASAAKDRGWTDDGGISDLVVPLGKPEHLRVRDSHLIFIL